MQLEGVAGDRRERHRAGRRRSTTPARRLVNNGITDIDALIERTPQVTRERLAGGGFELHRIGDAVTSRGVHSAVYDALRLASAL